MKDTISTCVASFADIRRDKRKFAVVLCILAFFVALGVTWGFKMVGISIAGDANVSDSKADVETAADWEKTLPELGDDWLENVAKIAKSQVGYTESSRNFIMADDGETPQGYTRYGAWFGSEYNDWDAMFASFCLHYAGVAKKDFPQSLGAYSWVSELKKNDLYIENEKLDEAGIDADEVAQARRAGNLVFFDTKGDGRADAVAVIVSADDNGRLAVVQGDVEGKVAEYKLNAKSDSKVIGYGLVPQNPKLGDQSAQAESAKAEAAESEAAEAEQAAAAKSKEEKKNTAKAAASDDDDEGEPESKSKSSSSANSTTEIAVCAQWEGDATAKKLKMTLVADGDTDNPVDTLTLSEDKDWQDSFEDVPVNNKKGEAITYSVVPAAAKDCDVATQVKTLAADALAQDGDDTSTEDLVKIANADAESEEAKSAEAETVSENVVSATEEGGNLSSSRVALYSFAYTPAAYASTGDARATVPTVPLTITKDWSDGNNAHSGESVTVDVKVTYEDGSAHNVTTTISSNDGWQKVVNVPANISIESCAVTERAVDGYDSYVEDVDIDATDVWIPVQANAVKSGETYAVVYRSTSGTSYYALSDSYDSLSIERANKGVNSTIYYDGVSYSDFLTGVSETAQWQWLASSGYSGRYLLKNASTSNYIYEKVTTSWYGNTYAFALSSSGGTPLVYSSSKTLMSTTNHYMVGSSGSTSYASSATPYTFYKKIRATSKMSTTVHNRKTAAATESATSVSVKKVWSDGNAKHANDSVTLHLTDVDNGNNRVASAAPVTLNADNNWQADDVWQNLLEGTYSIDEDAVAGYNTTVETSQDRKVIWVPVDRFEDGGIYAVVNNSSKAFIQAGESSGNSTYYGYVKTTSSADKANPKTKSLDFGGKQYSGYLDGAEVPIGAQWTAAQQGSAYALQSASSNGAEGGVWLYPQDYSYYYLRTGGSSYKSDSLFTYDGDTGYLYDRSLNSAGNRVGTYNGYFSINNTPAQKFTLYKRITLVDRQFTVVNTPIADSSATDLVEIEHNKYLDALRDGKSNPDTSFASGTDLTDLYRLYLDAGPLDLSQPVDLLLILDDSGSMGYNEAGLSVGASSSASRTGQLKNILTGSGQVIQQFLAANAKNRVGVVSFSGKGDVYSTDPSNDASVLTTTGTYYSSKAAWVNTTSAVNTALGKLAASGGTNYCAGLDKAGDLLNLPANGNKRVVVFLSDGVPTFYIDDNGVRRGHGFSDKGNSTSCIEPSIRAFDEFKAAYPDATTYTIGFSKDIGGNSSQVTSSPTVLRYYAEQGGGMYIQATNADVLSDQLSKLILGGGLFTNASISDTLSDAVDLYDAQPDYKVVMQKLVNGQTSGQPVVLWSGGSAKKQFTDDLDEGKSKDIVSSVTYDAATRTVTATFDPHYAMDPDYRYTVSFNVKTTNKAYTDYANDKSNGGDGYNGMKGDADTDYSPYTTSIENDTSSNKLGFRSNKSAQLNFKRGNSYYAMAYEHPVIQVGDCSFQIRKVDANNTGKLLSGARFSVYRKARSGETVSKIEGLDGSYYQVATDLRTVNGVATVSHLEPGTYWIVEDQAPDGYSRDGSAHEITLSRDAIVVAAGDQTVTYEGNENGSLVLEYTNKEGYLLPKTGGIGSDLFKTTGATLVVIAVGIGCVMARRKRRGGCGVPPC